MEEEKVWLLKEKYNGEKTEGFFADLKRLEAGEPLAYVIGFVPFLNTKIYLDSRPLIPRTETEFWVEKAISEIKLDQKLVSRTPRMLDLCAGSGCIGVAVLKNVSGTHVDFVEIDDTHHATIQKNLEENGIPKSRANIVGGDLFQEVTEKYDFILSNPPYIDPELNRTTLSVKMHEPAHALYGGDAGLHFLSKIIQEAPKFLTEKGVLYLEHEPEQKEALSLLALQCALQSESFPDQFGIIRYTRLSRVA